MAQGLPAENRWRLDLRANEAHVSPSTHKVGELSTGGLSRTVVAHVQVPSRCRHSSR
jgi:hypothetical protein